MMDGLKIVVTHKGERDIRRELQVERSEVPISNNEMANRGHCGYLYSKPISLTVLLLGRVGERQDVDGGIGEMEGVYILWRSLFICIFVHVNQMSANDAIGWTRQSIASIAYFTCMSGFHMHGPGFHMEIYNNVVLAQNL